MGRAFSDITFTDSVKAAQSFYGSRDHNRNFELASDPRNVLTEMAVSFISERDSFYQATVAENGWPYMQHRGGPRGFLKVLDDRTLGFADFQGNRQYLSVGNLQSDSRICLFLMDYANKRRLKIWGHAHIIHQAESADLVAMLEDGEYGAKIERGVVICVEALEWNCSKHITPRFTKEDVQDSLKHLIEENAALKIRLDRYEGNG